MSGGSNSFDIGDVERFTAGTVGAPGQRTFYLQVTHDGRPLSLKLEKQQVAALAEYLDNMMNDLPAPSAAMPVDLELAEPIIPEWIVASMGVAYSTTADRITLWAEEMLTDDESNEPAASARFQLTREQAVAYIHRARSIVGAGRPPCPYCGSPMSADGTWCACSN